MKRKGEDLFAVMNFSLYQILPDGKKISFRIIPNDILSLQASGSRKCYKPHSLNICPQKLSLHTHTHTHTHILGEGKSEALYFVRGGAEKE